MKYQNIREEELKNKVAHDYFWIYDCTKIIGNVDFCVCMHQSQSPSEIFEQESLLWAEAKKGSSDIYNSIVQLILTIGKARTFDKFLPPAMLGAFDAEKIAFIPYNDIHEVFYINDFNWNVTPSNHSTKEFKLIHDKVKNVIDNNALLFNFLTDDHELKKFIKNNFIVGKYGLTKTKIDKNNFMVIYNKWLQAVKPSIGLHWDVLKKNTGIIDGDFFLADLLSLDNKSLKEKLFVFLQSDHYELERSIDDFGMFQMKKAFFLDKQLAHTQFWNKYERPPKEEYWDYIVERRDLLVPQDVRERKGSYFTPQIWVELSQKYLTDVLGEDWQEEYYIWDCAAGTGNLLTGLSNKYNIWASTLDKQDVEVMHDRINTMNNNAGSDKGSNLLHEHVFQFDFLNDELLPISKGGKVPDSLYKVISNPEKRKKLVIYINPPYAESNGKVSINRSEIQNTQIHLKYFDKMEKGGAELFIQFLTRIYYEIPDCIIAQFSKLKMITSGNSDVFRSNYLAKLEKLFVVPADTFDNVKGQFPIGFFIWNTKTKDKINKIKADVYDVNGVLIGNKFFYSYGDEDTRINSWLNIYKAPKDVANVGILMADAPDFQNNNYVAIQNRKTNRHGKFIQINEQNILPISIYFAVRHCIEATWLNDRDQFLFPNNKWEKDTEFQNDCLAFTLFHGQNRISSKEGTNHWIPFSEYEVNAKEKFESHFMKDFIDGKLKDSIVEEDEGLFGKKKKKLTFPKLVFSPAAQEVFKAGLELWKYYHKQPDCNVNASLYDIREYFQGRNDKGKMNHKSTDETYTQLIADLRDSLKKLANQIEPKVYKYEFLKK